MEFLIPKGKAGDGPRAKAVDAVLSLNEGQSWAITIKEKKPRRSDQQNRYLFGVVYAEIERHVDGFTKEDIHEWCLGEWGGWEVVEAFGAKRQRPIRRSSKLNKQEFADFIADIQRRMAERGIYIPDPNE